MRGRRAQGLRRYSVDTRRGRRQGLSQRKAYSEGAAGERVDEGCGRRYVARTAGGAHGSRDAGAGPEAWACGSGIMKRDGATARCRRSDGAEERAEGAVQRSGGRTERAAAWARMADCDGAWAGEQRPSTTGGCDAGGEPRQHGAPDWRGETDARTVSSRELHGLDRKRH
jgi:hypothetical protein